MKLNEFIVNPFSDLLKRTNISTSGYTTCNLPVYIIPTLQVLYYTYISMCVSEMKTLQEMSEIL
jgi:hypothetical protein